MSLFVYAESMKHVPQWLTDKSLNFMAILHADPERGSWCLHEGGPSNMHQEPASSILAFELCEPRQY